MFWGLICVGWAYAEDEGGNLRESLPGICPDAKVTPKLDAVTAVLLDRHGRVAQELLRFGVGWRVVTG